MDPNLVVPDERKSLADGAIEPWSKSTTLYYAQTLSSLAKHYGFSLDEASTLNFVINQTYEVSSAWSFDETKSDCLMDTYSCPLALTAISNGSLDQYTNGWETRLRSCNIVF